MLEKSLLGKFPISETCLRSFILFFSRLSIISISQSPRTAVIYILTMYYLLGPGRVEIFRVSGILGYCKFGYRVDRVKSRSGILVPG